MMSLLHLSTIPASGSGAVIGGHDTNDTATFSFTSDFSPRRISRGAGTERNALYEPHELSVQ